MKMLFAFGAGILCLAGSEAQIRTPSPSRPPLVSPNASSQPLGGVALPSFPALQPPRRGKSKSSLSAPARYIGPVYYVPNAFDSTDYGPDPGPDSAAEQPPPPRRFRTQQRLEPPAPTDSIPAYQEASPPPEDYYLIAYKDHTVYPALSYWIDGETLHYLTTDRTHNQASIAFIDVDQTTKLNADRAVPFLIPGQ